MKGSLNPRFSEPTRIISVLRQLRFTLYWENSDIRSLWQNRNDQVNLVNCIISVKCGIQLAAILKPGDGGEFSFTVFAIELLSSGLEMRFALRF